MDDPHLSRRTTLQRAAMLGTLGTSTLAGCLTIEDAVESGTRLIGTSETLRFSQVLPPVALDPVVMSDLSSSQIASQVFEGLYTYTAENGTDPVPKLAAGDAEVSDQGTTYTIELEETAHFHSGDRVGAEDVVYSFETPQQEETPNAPGVEMIGDVSAVDDRTVEFSLEHAYSAFDHVLTQDIVPRAEREANPRKFAREEPIGTGPFRVETFKPEKYAIVTRWDDYWDAPAPTVDRVQFVPVHSDLARVMSLESKQNDIIERVPSKLWSVVKKMDGASIASTEGSYAHFLGFNCNEGPTEDPRVREAVARCIDVDKAVSNYVEPTGVRQHSPIPDWIADGWDLPLARWKDIPRGKNIRRARDLFDRAGVDDWAPLIAVPGTKNSGDKLRETFAEDVAHGLTEAGFRRARVKKYPVGKFDEKTVSGVPSDYAMFVRACPATPDPDSILYPQFHENNEGTTNGVFYAEESVMNDILEARRSTDRADRRQWYADAITALLEDWVCVPAYTLQSSFGVRDAVEGLEPQTLATENPQLVGDPSVSLH